MGEPTEIKVTCQITGQVFPWSRSDQELFDRLTPTFNEIAYPFPLPRISPLERKRQRLAFRNERNLYHRNSSLSGRPIISMYSPDKPFPVFAKDEYWSDACDPLKYGVEFDFTRPFFEQLAELKSRVPRVALISDPDAEKNNCAYINCAGFSKNCYMAFNADQNQDCYYISSTFYCTDCVDCSHMQSSEMCYECIGCTRCWDLRYSQDCTDCSSSRLLFCCVGCQDCYCCANLIKRQYCIQNVQYSKQQYFDLLKAIDWSSRTQIQLVLRSFEDFLVTQPRKYAQILRAENCTGDYIVDSNACFECFNIRECRDLRYVDTVHRANDCMDLSAFGVGIELVYNSTSIGVNSSRIYCSFACVMGSSNLSYCDECRQSQDCFGCISLKRSQYCILNKKYSREEYFRILPRVIEHLRQTGEWGSFFPYYLSPFGYNESVAQEKMPLSQVEATARNISWHDPISKLGSSAQRADQVMPDSVLNSNESVCELPVLCADSGKPFKISKAEYAYYRKFSIPLPICCSDVRYRFRESRRNPEQLWPRSCAETGELVLTTYPPSFSGKVLGQKAFEQING